MALEVWPVPAEVWWKVSTDAAWVPEVDSLDEDSFIIITRDDERNTVGTFTFFRGNGEGSSERFVAFLTLMDWVHEGWAEEASRD